MISNLLIGILIGMLLQIAPLVNISISAVPWNYLIATVLAMLVRTPVAFVALRGRGDLATLGLVALVLRLASSRAPTEFGLFSMVCFRTF